jgi:endonuclease YncB( thermonuclease family)
MSRRSRRGYWPVFLLLMAVGYLVRGTATPTPSRPAGTSPTSRGTERPEKQLVRTPTRVSHPVENPSPEEKAPVARNRGQHLSLRVVGVHDGDTLTGLDESKTQFKVRLDAIDAPELGQPFGQASKRALSEKVFGKDVVVIAKTRDKYGRTVGHVMVDGRDVNLEMLEEGMAWHYEKYDHNKRLRAAEQAARAAQRGLWQDLTSVPPWDWRKSRKQRQQP